MDMINYPMRFISMLYLTYTLFIGIINNKIEADIELTSCRQTLNPFIVSPQALQKA